MFETMAIEIEQLLARLTGVNDKMAEYTHSAGVPSLNAALMHTLQRHRDILQVAYGASCLVGLRWLERSN